MNLIYNNKKIEDWIFENIDGTSINYVSTCKKEAWLYIRKISANQLDKNIQMGRTLANLRGEDKRDIFDILKFDKIDKRKNGYVVTEFKKSLKNSNAGKMQLLFYIYLLKIANINVITGVLQSKSKKLKVEPNETNFRELEDKILELRELIFEKTPPKVKFSKTCNSCGYRDYCF